MYGGDCRRYPRRQAVIKLVRASGETFHYSDEPANLTGAERQVIQNVNQRQLISDVLAIRRKADSGLIDIVRATQSAARVATEMGSRHWDLWSVLRCAKTGNGDVVSILEAMQLRAAYADILAAAGPVELAAWGQQAIDTGGAILADAVLRENGARKAEERPFMGATLLTLPRDR